MIARTIFSLFLVLVGCAFARPTSRAGASLAVEATFPLITGSHVSAPAPIGYTDMCVREKGNPLCGKNPL